MQIIKLTLKIIFGTLPYNWAIPHLGIYPPEMKRYPTQILYINVHSNIIQNHQKLETRDFTGGTVVKNLPVNAGDMDLIPGLGRSHMPRSN